MAEPILRRTRPEFAHLPGEADLPYEDDEPLAESDYQLEPLDYAYNGLSTWFQDRADVAVQAGMFVHYPVVGEDGEHERRMLAPDVSVLCRMPKRQRFSYVVWEEGKAPDFVLEILSASTWRRDTADKKAIYAAIGVRDYWLLDPVGPFLTPPLIGYRPTGEEYAKIGAEPGTTATYVSDVLGLELRIDNDDRFRIPDPGSGIELRSHREFQEDLAGAQQRAAEAERRLADLEARLRRESE
ncbi:MAG: Uma2 family endonuclease [Gammaproteobacteria bacterium]|nr:Uma2 family endonuclease [Gammaproteobacteria bacterium]